MTEREKMIELINAKQVYGIDQDQPRRHDMLLLDNEDLADYLLANGIIVPPCKVGDTVYVLCPKEKHWDAVDRKWIITAGEIKESNVVSVHHSENKQGKKTSKYRCSRIDIPSVCRDYAVDDFGKTVFLSREEAEKALAERSRG